MSMMAMMYTSKNTLSHTMGMAVDRHGRSCIPSAVASSAGLLCRSKKNETRIETPSQYHDHANEFDGYQQSFDVYDIHDTSSMLFPIRLHKMLQSIEDNNQTSVISWQPHGRCFVIHKPTELLHILPQYFSHKNLASFKRQLNLYGFKRIAKGSDRGGYYHECFLRGKPFLALYMSRQTLKGTRHRTLSHPRSEPDFWLMPWVKPSRFAVTRDQFNVSSSLRATSNENTSPTPTRKISDCKIGSIVTTLTSSSSSSVSSISSPSSLPSSPPSSTSSASSVPPPPPSPPHPPTIVKSIDEVGDDGKSGTTKHCDDVEEKKSNKKVGDDGKSGTTKHCDDVEEKKSNKKVGDDGKSGTTKHCDDVEEKKSNKKVNEPSCVIGNKLFFPVDTCEDDQDGTSLTEDQEKEEKDCYRFPMIDQDDGLADLANVCTVILDNLLSKNIA